MGKENKTACRVSTTMVSPSELELVREFISFLQGREWGEFKAIVSCHKKTRRVLISKTDITNLELSKIEK